MSAGRRRPRVALVSLDMAESGEPRGLLPSLVEREHDRIDFVVLSRTLWPALRPLVEWRRVPALPGIRPGVATFLPVGSLRLARVRADLVHVNCALPIVLNRSDLVWNHFLLADFEEQRDTRSFAGRVLGPPIKALALVAERRAFSRTRILAAVSEGSAETARRHLPQTRVEVLHLPVDTTRFHADASARRALRAEAGVGDEETVALFVGREWRHKGLDLAIRALARADAEAGPFRLWVAGGPTRSRRMASLAAEVGVADRVELLGLRPDIERLYQAADLLVLPTLYENCSRAMLEAAASELPMVVTRVHGVDEIVGGDEAGLVVERSVDALAGAMARLARDGELRQRLGRAGRGRILGFTPARNLDRMVAFYRELLPPELAEGLEPRSYDPS